MEKIVDELHAEGATDVAGMMINNPGAVGQGGRLDALDVQLPALQDTFQLSGGTFVPAIGSLLDCLENDELLLVDPQGRLHLKVTASPNGYDLREPGPREEVKSWVRSMAPLTAKLP